MRLNEKVQLLFHLLRRLRPEGCLSPRTQGQLEQHRNLIKTEERSGRGRRSRQVATRQSKKFYFRNY